MLVYKLTSWCHQVAIAGNNRTAGRSCEPSPDLVIKRQDYKQSGLFKDRRVELPVELAHRPQGNM